MSLDMVSLSCISMVQSYHHSINHEGSLPNNLPTP